MVPPLPWIRCPRSWVRQHCYSRVSVFYQSCKYDQILQPRRQPMMHRPMHWPWQQFRRQPGQSLLYPRTLLTPEIVWLVRLLSFTLSPTTWCWFTSARLLVALSPKIYDTVVICLWSTPAREAKPRTLEPMVVLVKNHVWAKLPRATITLFRFLQRNTMVKLSSHEILSIVWFLSFCTFTLLMLHPTPITGYSF